MMIDLKLNDYAIDRTNGHRAKIIYVMPDGASCQILDYATFSTELRTADQLSPSDPPPWDTAHGATS